MQVIEIRGLTRDYGGGRGVFDLSFGVEHGECAGFLGPNGAGKTTTIRHLMGFLKPKQGVCRINAMDCLADRAVIQCALGYIPGEIAFMQNSTGLGFIKFMAAYRGLSDLSRAHALMERFELDAAGKIKKMSKGMKQKVGIVCAFMHDPAVYILDEPTAGLDPLMQSRFVELLAEEKARGKTILMSSHSFDEVERTCDRVAIIKEGRLVTMAAIDELRAKQRRTYVVTLRDEDAAAAFAAEPAIAAEPLAARVRVAVGNDLSPFIAAMSRHAVTAIDAEGQSLEDVFMHFYDGGGEES